MWGDAARMGEYVETGSRMSLDVCHYWRMGGSMQDVAIQHCLLGQLAGQRGLFHRQSCCLFCFVKLCFAVGCYDPGCF